MDVNLVGMKRESVVCGYVLRWRREWGRDKVSMCVCDRET